MLVHKRTMGVLEFYWTGLCRTDPDGVSVPVMAEYRMDGGFDPAQWWQVPRGSPLARKLRRYYPYCTPVVGGDGSLVDVTIWPKWKRSGLAGPPPAPRQKKRGQYRRRAGLLENALKEELTMITLIEIREHDNGGHNNQTGDWSGPLPEGYAVFPDGPEAENYPFFRVDRVEEIDGVLTVTQWHPLPVPEPEPPAPSEQDRLEAQVAYTAMMTDTLLEG